MKYFLHDSSAFQDEKVTELYINFGYEGIGLFFTILEKIAFQEQPVKTEVLKKQLNIRKKLEKIWKFLEEIELISTKNGETFNKNILNYSKKYLFKKEKTRIRVENFRKNKEVTENVTCYEPVTDALRNADVTLSNIIKDNISKDIREDKGKTSFSDSLQEPIKSIFISWLEYKKEIKKSYKSEKSIEICYNQLMELSGNNPDKAQRIINQSIASGWSGLFELKNNNNTITKNKEQQEEEDKYLTAIKKMNITHKTGY